MHAVLAEDLGEAGVLGQKAVAPVISQAASSAGTLR
jgi:hypothetical protein